MGSLPTQSTPGFPGSIPAGQHCPVPAVPGAEALQSPPCCTPPGQQCPGSGSGPHTGQAQPLSCVPVVTLKGWMGHTAWDEMQSTVPVLRFFGKSNRRWMEWPTSQQMLPKIITWLHKVGMVHGMGTASLLPMVLHAELDLVLCECVFIPCWVHIDPASLFGKYENF